MKKLKIKFLLLFASIVFSMSLQHFNMVSRSDMYQGEEPEELKKYKK